MKIPVKSIEKIEVTSYIEKEVTANIEVGKFIENNHPHFNDLIKYFLNDCEFVATSCAHTDFQSFPSFIQGGFNSTDIIFINIIHEEFGKITFDVAWSGGDKNSEAIVILRRKSIL